jgi:serine protease Do
VTLCPWTILAALGHNQSIDRTLRRDRRRTLPMNRRLPWLGLILALISFAPAPAPKRDADVGKAYQVPYRLTDTNHFLVRVRINGKGPFNFLVDTGAPALFVATETAKRIGLKPAEDDFWTPVDRLEFEGGAVLHDVKARVEDPFQLVGMNALGLPGASIDGILGFTILAKFKLEIDLTKDRMTWTRLAFNPKDPPVPRRAKGQKPPAEMQAMNTLGPIAKFAAALVGKQPEEKLEPRGFLGVELVEAGPPGVVKVDRVLPDSPAAKGGVKPGDTLVRVGAHDVKSTKSARLAMALVKPGDSVALIVSRDGVENEVPLALTAGEGL